MDPPTAHPQAVLATLAARCHIGDLVEVGAGLSHGVLLSGWVVSGEATWRQLVGRDDAEPSGPIVVARLLELGPGVHHEGSVVRDRSSDRQPAEEDHVERLARGGGDDEVVARAEHDELTVFQPAPIGPGGAATTE